MRLRPAKDAQLDYITGACRHLAGTTAAPGRMHRGPARLEHYVGLAAVRKPAALIGRRPGAKIAG